MEAVRARETGGPRRLNVGIADAMIELVTYRLLAPARPLARPTHQLCREEQVERLLAAFSVHEVDPARTGERDLGHPGAFLRYLRRPPRPGMRRSRPSPRQRIRRCVTDARRRGVSTFTRAWIARPSLAEPIGC